MIKNDIEKAISIATTAHHSQLDVHGEPYILHPLRVMLKLEGDKRAMMLGVLHDTIEIANVPIDYLKNIFDEELVSILICLTKLPEEFYDNYIQRISQNKIALKVKLADIEDNLTPERLKTTEIKDFEKYIKAYNFLKLKEQMLSD